MKKHEIVALLSEKIDEVFAEIQKQEGIIEGDIDFEDVIALDQIAGQAAERILKVIEYQKRWEQ